MIPPPRQGGGGTRAPALTYVVTLGGVVVHVVVSVGGGFLVKCCVVSALQPKIPFFLSLGIFSSNFDGGCRIFSDSGAFLHKCISQAPNFEHCDNNHQHSTRKTPSERINMECWVGGEKQKARNFWLPRFGPHPLGSPHFLVLGFPAFVASTFRALRFRGSTFGRSPKAGRHPSRLPLPVLRPAGRVVSWNTTVLLQKILHTQT